MSRFDSPQSEDNLADDSGGMSAFDFEGLPPTGLTITRVILRHRELTHAGLWQAIAALPADEQLSRAEIDAGLALLLQNSQVIEVATEDGPVYKVNLRRKQGSRLRRGIWDALDAADPSDDLRTQQRARRREQVQHVWDTLDDPAPRRRLPDFSLQPAPSPPAPDSAADQPLAGNANQDGDA